MIALLMPFTQMFLLGYGVTLDLKHIPVCTFDREASQDSQALLKRFEASMYFEHRPQRADLSGSSSTRSTAADCKIAVVIPPDFSAAPRRQRHALRSRLILDATDDNTANIALGYALAVVVELFERGGARRRRRGRAVRSSRPSR